MRLDRLLFQLRFAHSRTLAQAWIATGHLRRNGQRVTRKDQPIVPGDVLTLPLPAGVIVVEIMTLPIRRGPPAEARACYRALDAGGSIAIAGAESRNSEGTAEP